METKKELKVSQTVWYKIIDSRSGADKSLKQATITKVGSKYFEIDVFNRTTFFKDSLFENGGDYSPYYKVYLSVEDRENEIESEKIYSEIQNRFNGYRNSGGLTLNQLREIQTIINLK